MNEYGYALSPKQNRVEFSLRYVYSSYMLHVFRENFEHAWHVVSRESLEHVWICGTRMQRNIISRIRDHAHGRDVTPVFTTLHVPSLGHSLSGDSESR